MYMDNIDMRNMNIVLSF